MNSINKVLLNNIFHHFLVKGPFKKKFLIFKKKWKEEGIKMFSNICGLFEVYIVSLIYCCLGRFFFGIV
jgi:hypothetical protein